MALGGAEATEPCSPWIDDGYRLVLADEMDGEALDTTLWATRWLRWNIRHLEGNDDKALKAADHERLGGEPSIAERLAARYGARSSYLHEVSDGTLKLRAYPADPPILGFPYVASMISTERTFAQRYGYWELRLRLPAVGKGHHVAVWLLPEDGSWPPEIDIMEVVGDDSRVYANAHTVDRPAGVPGITWIEPVAGHEAWRTLGFEWTPAEMTWTIDGETVRQHRSVDITQPLHLLVTWEIGSRWPGPTDATTPWPGVIEIDHIRVYARNGG